MMKRFIMPEGTDEIVVFDCWQPWFAWYPVLLQSKFNSTPRRAWLRTVMLRHRACITQDPNGGNIEMHDEWSYEEPFTVAALYDE